MKKNELIKRVAEKSGKTIKETKVLLDQIETAIYEGLEESGEVRFNDLGKFYLVELQSRKCRNPKTGEEFMCEPKKVLRFKPSASNREEVEKM